MGNDHWKVADYGVHANFVSKLTQEVMQDLSPQKGEKILDLGCGDGELAAIMQGLGCKVVGIDSSPDLVSAARARGVDARVGDAQEIDFRGEVKGELDGEFDAVFSNAALHWMPHQDQIIRRVYMALKPGGRFIAEMGGAGNISCIAKAMTIALAEHNIDFATRNPWTFPTPETQQTRLERAGFKVSKCALRPRLTILPTDVRGWFVTFCSQILSDFSPETHVKIIDRLEELCRADLCGADDKWVVDYVRLNFAAVKP